MIKKLLLLIFIFTSAPFLNAENHDIHKQIADIRVEIEKIRNSSNKIDLKSDFDKLEMKINKLEDDFNQNNIDKKDIEKTFENTIEIVERQDTRLEDLNHYFFWYGILITILLFGVSYISYRFTSNHARDIVNDWLKKNKDEILEPIRNEAKDLEKNIERRALDIYQEKLKEYKIDDKLDESQKESQKETIKKVIEILEKKEKEEYTYSDWFSRFIDIKNKGDKKRAELFINKALNLASNDTELSHGLFQKAYLFDTVIKDKKAALDVYDEIINKFSNTTDNFILEIVITSMNNKAVIFLNEKEYKERLKVQEQIINKFENNQNISIQEIVASNAVGVGWYYSHIDDNERAIIAYNEIISKYKNFPGKTSLSVRDALLNKFEIYLIENKTFENEDIELFEKISANTNDMLGSLIFEFLKILESAKDSNQDINIKRWQEKLKITSLSSNWHFESLENWANTFKDNEVKNRLLRYIDVFSKHSKTK